MKRPRRASRGWGRIAQTIAALVLVSGCAAVLGLDGYEDAAAALCACPGFEKVDSCAERARARLAAATPKDRESWLRVYEQKQCGTLCERAAECYAALPGCEGDSSGCECCPWNQSVLSCDETNTCKSCRPCRALATQKDGGGLECARGRALLRDLKACACSDCLLDCTGFCQDIDSLTDDLNESCRGCLETSCKAAIDACFTDDA